MFLQTTMSQKSLGFGLVLKSQSAKYQITWLFIWYNMHFHSIDLLSPHNSLFNNFQLPPLLNEEMPQADEQQAPMQRGQQTPGRVVQQEIIHTQFLPAIK